MLGFYDKLPPHHHDQSLFQDEYVCVVRRRHPTVKSKLTSDSTSSCLTSWSRPRRRHGSVDRALLALGKQRTIGARVSHFLTVPVLVSRTDDSWLRSTGAWRGVCGPARPQVVSAAAEARERHDWSGLARAAAG